MLMMRRGARAAPRQSRLRLHGRPPVRTSGAAQSCGVWQTGPAGGHSTVNAPCLQQSGAAADLEELEAIDDSVLDLADLEEFAVSSPAHRHCAVAVSWEGLCAALAAVRTRTRPLRLSLAAARPPSVELLSLTAPPLRQFDEEDDEDEGGRDDDAEDVPEGAGGAGAKPGLLGAAGAGSAQPGLPAAQAPDQRAPGPQPALGAGHVASGAAALAEVDAGMAGGSTAGGGGEDAPIWSRTRARQPLGHVSLEALEALLGESDDEELWPALGDEGAAYRDFLAARPLRRAQRRLAALERRPPAAMCITRWTCERVSSQCVVRQLHA